MGSVCLFFLEGVWHISSIKVLCMALKCKIQFSMWLVFSDSQTESVSRVERVCVCLCWSQTVPPADYCSNLLVCLYWSRQCVMLPKSMRHTQVLHTLCLGSRIFMKQLTSGTLSLVQTGPFFVIETLLIILCYFDKYHSTKWWTYWCTMVVTRYLHTHTKFFFFLIVLFSILFSSFAYIFISLSFCMYKVYLQVKRVNILTISP